MAFDQNIRYKVSVDDSDFQSKLSNLRASLDMTMGGMSGMGGIGMGGGAGFTGMMGAMMAPQGGYGAGSGLADFGSQIRPITYTPPAISMQPHFGMAVLQQSTGQAVLGAMGPLGLGVQAAANFARNPFGSQPNVVPQNMSMSEYMTLSTRSFATRLGDAASTAGLVGAGTAAGLVGSGMGAAAGEFLGGTLGSVAGGLAGGMLVGQVVSSTGEMMAQNRGIQTQLAAGSFRFMTGGKDVDPLTGRGFSRAARAEVADFVQSKELKDLRFGMPEMREILESGMQLDMFSGTRDVQDFKQKFSGLVDTMKVITSTLHTSVKEGMEVMRGFRDIGVTDPGQMSKMTLQAETTGRMAGRTGMEMLSLGQAGAEIFRGTGVSMQLGAEANMQNVAMVRQMLNMGTINRDTVAQAGGENSLAQQMTASALAATQSAVGRGLLLGSFDPKSGGLRPDLFGGMARGGLVGVMGRAASMSPQQIMHVQAHEEDMISSMNPMQLQLFGMQGDLMQAKMVADAFGGKPGTPGYQTALEDSFINAEKRRGVPIAAIRANLGLLHTDPQKLKESQEAAMTSMAQQAAYEDVRNNFNPLRAASNLVRRTLIQPIQRAFTDISTDIGVRAERLGMSLMGAALPTETGADRTTYERGRRLIESTAGGADALTQGTSLGVIDASGSLYQRLALGGGQSGEAMARSFERFGTAEKSAGDKTGLVMENMKYENMTAMRFKNVDDVKRYNAQTGQQMEVLTRSGTGGTVLAIPVKQLSEARRQHQDTASSVDDIDKANKAELTDEQIVAVQKLHLQEQATGKQVGFRSVVKALFGEKAGDKDSYGFQSALASRISGDQGFSKALEQSEQGRTMYGSAEFGGAKSAAAAASEALESGRSALMGSRGLLNRLLGGDDTKETALAMRMAVSGDEKERLKTRAALFATLESKFEAGHATKEQATRLAEEKVRDFESHAKNLTAEQRTQLNRDVKNYEVAATITEDERKKGMGIGFLDKFKNVFTGGGAGGQLSSDQTKQVGDMANQNLETMKLVEQLQKYVLSRMPP